MSKSNGERQTNFNAIDLGSLRGGGMASKTIYKITVTNFAKHNATIKKGHKSTLISNRFCQDAKLRMLPITSRWLFLNLILTCGDLHSDTIELSQKSIRDMLECRRNIDRELDSLMELQLVTYEKIEFLLNRIEKKRIEKKIIEGCIDSKKGSRKAAPVAPIEGVNEVIKLYCDTWKLRYKSDRSPDIRGKDVGLVKGLVKDLGRSRVELLVQAYLSMPDGWFVTKKHDITTLIANMNSVSLFADSGRLITKSEINQLDKQVTNQNTLEALKKGAV